MLFRSKNRAGSAFLTVFLAAVVAHAADWPCFRGGPGRTGYYPGNIVSLDSIKPIWTDSIKCEIVSSPAIVNNVLFIGCRDNGIRAISVATGSVRWTFKTGGWVDASPLINGARVMAGSRDGSLYVLDTARGTLVRKIAAGVQLSSPAIVNGSVLAGSGQPFGGLFGVDTAAQTNVPDWTISFLQYCYSSPAVLGSRAFIGANDGFLYACNLAEDRGIQWLLFTGSNAYMTSPAVDDSIVYFASGGTVVTVFALRAATGAAVWKSTAAATGIAAGADGPVNAAAEAVFRQLVSYAPASRDRIIGRLEKAGLKKSVHQGLMSASARAVPADSFFSYHETRISSVAVDKRHVYLCMRELGFPKPLFSIVAIDKKSGNAVWRFSRMIGHVPIGYCSSPAVSDSFVFAGAGEGRLFAFRSRDGKPMWEDSVPGGDIISSPALASGKLFVATRTGKIRAYDLQERFPRIITGTFMDSTFSYPNPARRGVAHIKMFMPKDGTVELVLYNSDERAVVTFVRFVAAGDFCRFDWNTRSAANGVYFARISARYADGSRERKILKVAVLN